VPRPSGSPRTLLLTPPTGDQRRAGTLRSAAAATYLRRALAEQERGEILADLGRYEVATMQFEAAENHLRAALASGATLATRADAASWLGRCATVSGGHSAAAAAGALSSLAGELWPADPERSLELGSELLIVTATVPQLGSAGKASCRAAPSHQPCQEQPSRNKPSPDHVCQSRARRRVSLGPLVPGSAYLAEPARGPVHHQYRPAGGQHHVASRQQAGPGSPHLRPGWAFQADQCGECSQRRMLSPTGPVGARPSHGIARPATAGRRADARRERPQAWD